MMFKSERVKKYNNERGVYIWSEMRIIYELKKSGEFKSVLHSFNGLYIS